ncbi:MAG: hypothetical protein ACD_33C00014G0005 [uncultured bacterium]|nr:MAG: hypothetical protein ACD_33C00014G0005 [uncultured bacterium]
MTNKYVQHICIYENEVIVDETFNKNIKECFINHLNIYNHALEISFNNPAMGFKEKRKLVNDYINNKNFNNIVIEAVYMELYYQHKKFIKNIKSQKLLTSIQYLTFINKGLIFDFINNTVKIKNIDGIIKLEKPITKEMLEGDRYINFSYSGSDNKYLLKIVKTVET